MFAAERKFKKSLSGRQPTDLEKQVSQALFDLEVNSKELKTDLQPVRFSAAKEVRVSSGSDTKAIVIFVPLYYLSNFRRIHTKLVAELEKKFVGRHVIIVGNRTSLPKPKTGNDTRPQKKTVASVRENLLRDVAYPVEIVGQRTRVSVDGRQRLRVFLDPKEEENVRHKLKTFSKVYRALTGKTTSYEFYARK